MKTYHVRIGGLSSNAAAVYGVAEAAEAAAIRMARAMAGSPEERTSVAIYGCEGGCGWGACPDGDEGAYWPVIEAKECLTPPTSS